MKIKVVSDLHLEFSDINITNDEGCDVLVLSGDIMITADLHEFPEQVYSMYNDSYSQPKHGTRRDCANRYRDFLKRVSFQFPHVVYVMGNHEFYHGCWSKSIDHLRSECEKFPNVHLLEREVFTLDDVTFIGSTLWTDMNKGDPLTLHAVRGMMMDFRCIKDDTRNYGKLSPIDTARRHINSLGYIKNIVAEKHDAKFVVVGHHSPSFQSVHEQYQHETLMNGAYHSDLSEFILDHPQIKLWTHGHTHHPFDYMIGETRIVCNPRGYEGFEPDSHWNPNFVLEI